MTDVLIARQPIFDAQLDVVGYELLFRDGVVDNAVVVDPEGATATVMLGSLTEIGIEQVAGSRPAWINVSRDFVVGEFAQLLPPSKFMLELLEDQIVDDELIEALGELKRQGHRVALDDFIYEPGSERLLALADIVKLDLLALGTERFAAEVARLRPYDVTLLAEKLETYDDYRFAADSGCSLFQGFFFCRPEVVRGDHIDANRMSLLQLLASLNRPDIELAELERLFAVDARLSYRLLRYINSAFFGLGQEVRSIGQAVALLGLDNLKRWVALSLFTAVDDKPSELAVMALIRARFCELTAGDRDAARSSELFMIGLLSLVDALLDIPLAEAIDKIPLTRDAHDALLDHTGPEGGALECVTALELGLLAHAQAIIPGAGGLYLDAVVWAAAAAESLLLPA